VFAVFEAVPEIVIVLLFATAFAAILAFLSLAGSRVFHISIGEETSGAMQRAQTAVTGFTAIVTAFSLVQAQITLANIQKLVSTEADQLNQLDRLLTRYGDPSVGRIRETLRAYAESVVRDEWPELGRGRGSPITTRLFTPLSKSILAIDPSPGRQSVIYTDMLKNVDNLAESRSNRLLAAQTTLPAIFWDVILLLLALLAGFALLGEARRGNAVALAGQGFGLALLIGLVFVLDFLFYGETVVSSQPLVSALAAMHARAG
jgi:hypothetical protein